ncbi:MAG TPA: methyltransferase domain-containing protein [Nitrospirales bacterium]|nr:methyltransferase domain-containing protein [Nitrospirales bacterium]
MANETEEQNHSITQTVSQRYAKAVTNGEQLCCPTGYNHEDLGQFIPEPVLKVSYGCGTPVGLSTVQQGEVVLDIGSGGGIDCFEASRKVGAQGRVIGIDMTDEMLALARTHAPMVAKNLGYPEPNVDFRKGFADAMPVDDDQVDLIVSNCVINLAPDKGKVFQEMYRVLRPGGRFTISDIVADQPIPNYLIYDKAKWGDCLSGALTIKDYWGGLWDAGFKGVHLVNHIPWRVIDGIQFLSVTLTGYKLASASTTPSSTFATLTGPFSQVVDDLGSTFTRGHPQQINERTAALLALAPYQDLFIIDEKPVALAVQDPRMRAVYPDEAPCVWEGQFAVLTGPFLAVCDDDHHTYQCGEPIEICSKTYKVLQTDSYQPYFATINRSRDGVHSEPVICGTSEGCC